MGFLSNAAKSIGSQKSSDSLGSAVGQMVGGKRYRAHHKAPEALLREYAGYVYRAIDKTATSAARVPIYTEQLVNGTWVRKSHTGMTALLQGTKDTPSMTWMMTGTTVYKKMFGEAFWYVNVMESSRKPYDRILLYPHLMKVIADTTGKVIGYEYTTTKGTKVPLNVDEVIHFKYFNPSNHQRGLGPLQAAGLYVDAERNTVEYVNNFIDNNATPTGIVVLPASTGETQFNAFETQWREKYGGIDNVGKTAILQSDGVDFKQISSNLKDMQLTELKGMSIQDVLAMFGVSKHMIGISDEGGLGRNTAEAHEYIFDKHVIDPEIHDDVDTLNDAFERYFTAEFDGDDSTTNGKWRVWYTSPVPDNQEAINNKLTNGKDSMTLNERRALLDLPPVKGGDTITDVDGNVLTAKELKASNTAKKSITLKVRVKGGTQPVSKVSIKDNAVSHEEKEAYRLRIQDKQTAYERRYKKIVKGFIDRQMAQVVDDIAGHKSVKSMMDGNLNPAKQAQELTELSIGVYLDLLQEQGDLAIKFAGDTEKFVITQDAKNYVKESLQRAHLSYNEDIVKAIGQAVSEGLAANESLPQIGKRVTEQYESIKGYKMTRLVRTETLKASNEATLYGYQQLGITQKEWFNNPGACDYCQEVQGMGSMGMGDVFLAKGEALTDSEGNERVYDYEDVEHPPLHANCRCVLLPVREG